MLPYIAIGRLQTENNTNTHNNNSNNNISHELIETCVKLFRLHKSHRNAAEFDTKFVKNILMEMGNVGNGVDHSIGNVENSSQ